MSPDGLRNRIAWIAVALATAIRLFAGSSWMATPVLVAILAIAAIALTADRMVRIAALFLLVVAAIDLYILRSQSLSNPAVTVQAFQRVVNQPKAHSIFDPDDDWIMGTVFHAGVLRQESGTRRYVVERRPDSALWIDVAPRSSAEAVESTRAAGRDAAAIFLALASLTMILLLGERRSPWLTALLIAAARVALLPLRFDQDPAHIFGFEV